jgi:hypothetical protein
MPAGDPQRTWFPEMVDELRTRWRAELPLSDLIQLRNDLDAMLHRIRSERNIRPPVIRCPRCGHTGPAAEPDVSVRATILALGRYGIASVEEVKALDRRWAAYRKANDLDLHGNPAATQASTDQCGH